MPEQPASVQPPKFPDGVRFCQEADRAALFDLFMAAHAENGWGGCDPSIVRDVIARAIARETYVIAVVPGARGIEAAIGLQPARNWYGDIASWYWQELVVFVRRDCRRSRHAAKLMAFAQWFERVAEAPVLICSMPRERAESKRRFFGRYGREVTSVFLIGDGTFRYAQADAA